MKKDIRVLGPAILAASITLAICITLSTPGCVSTQTVTPGAGGTLVTNTVVTLNTNAITLIRTASAAAAGIEVGRDRNSAPYLMSAASVIQLAINNGQYDPQALGKSLSAISVKELRSETAHDTILALLQIYQFEFGQTVTAAAGLDRPTWLRQLLQAMSDGIISGIAATQ